MLYESLNRLQTSSNPELDSINFISRFLSLHGYKPQLETCVSCSEDVGADLLSAQESKKYPYSSILGGILCNNCSSVVNSKPVDLEVLKILLESESSSFQVSQNKNIRSAVELLREHLDIRAKNKIKSFDLVFSL